MYKNKLLGMLCFVIGIIIIYYIIIMSMNNFVLMYPSFVSINNNDIQYYVVNETLTNSNGTFIIENNTDDTWIEGKRYLEKKINGIWHRFIPKRERPTLLTYFFIHPNSKFEIYEDFEYRFGKLTKGKYRIINETKKRSEKDIEEEKDVVVYFEIK